MKIVHSLQEMSAWRKEQTQAGKTVALAPTMGFFHEGHLSLMRKAAELADNVVVSLFVNPIQFGPSEDLEQYPRDFVRDCRLVEGEKVDILFVPEPALMYPEGFQSSVQVELLEKYLCGVDRPGHFKGVATVVCKLFNIIQPDCAVFGEKDFQQLAVIRRMVSDLNMNVAVIGHPIVREPDGLAMSSRNTYLDPEARKKALCLSGALALARKKVTEGIVDTSELVRLIVLFINKHHGVTIDYVSFADSRTLEPVLKVDQKTVLALAVKINNKVRLIDNGFLSGGSSPH